MIARLRRHKCNLQHAVNTISGRNNRTSDLLLVIHERSDSVTLWIWKQEYTTCIYCDKCNYTLAMDRIISVTVKSRT